MEKIWRDWSIHRKLTWGFLSMTLLVAVTGGIHLHFNDQTAQWGIAAGLKTGPHMDAAWEMRLKVEDAHLSLEEYINDPGKVRVEEEIFGNLSKAEQIADLLLDGGRNGQVELQPLDNPESRATIADFKGKISRFSQSARALIASRQDSSGIGSVVDDRYDHIYLTLQEEMGSLRDAAVQKGMETLGSLGEIRFQLANSHLFLEELLAKDKLNSYDIDKILASFDEAETLLATLNNVEADKRRAVGREIRTLRDLTQERYTHYVAMSANLSRHGEAVNQSYQEISQQMEALDHKLELEMVESMNFLVAGVALSRQISLVVLSLGIGLGLLLAWLLARGITRPLIDMTRVIGEITQSGDFTRQVSEAGGSELGILGRAFNLLTRKTEQQNLIRNTTAQMVTLVQRARTHTDLANEVLSRLVPTLGAGSGALLVKNESSDQFDVRGMYGADSEPHRFRSFAPGEGLVGQCAKEREIILLDEVPADYPHIQSGLGAAAPLHLMLMPVIHQNRVLAVLEVASFTVFTPLHHAILENFLPALALGIEGLNRLRQTEDLLEEAQRQSEELEMQQDELNQANESLREQTSRLEESENELKVQQDELRVANEELESRAALLEHSKGELERAHSDIAEKAAYLEQASRYKSEFLANMSHELRTPLNSILLLSKLFAEDDHNTLTEEQVEAARVIHGSGQDLLSLINDILDLAKIEAGRVEVAYAELETVEFLAKLRSQFQPMADDRKLEFRIERGEGVPENLVLDVRKVEQVLRNLLSNAFKFTPHGSVTLSLDVDGGKHLNWAVIDTGIGIPANKLNLIFEAFHQVDGGINRSFGGTGLGLSISRELARLMQGEIRVESRENEGSRFTLRLPLNVTSTAEDNDADGPEETVAEALSSLQRPPQPVMVAATLRESRPQPAIAITTAPGPRDADKEILVIEDDPRFFDLISGIAHKKGYHCTNARDGVSGLDLATHRQFLGVILDPGLPDMDGLVVLDRLKHDPRTRHLPVHVISAREFGAEILEKGAIGAYHKPVSIEQILQLCKKFESMTRKGPCNILLAEDDPDAAFATSTLIRRQNVSVAIASTGEQVMEKLRAQSYDCLVLDLMLPDISGFELLDLIESESLPHKPHTIVYSGKTLSREEHQALREHTNSIVVKGEASPDRLMEEISLFLHSVEQRLPERERASAAWLGHQDDAIFMNKNVLVVDDDMRNTFALKRALNLKGVQVLVAPDGQKALEMVERHGEMLHLVFMDIMMPVMDGYQAILAIRKQERFKKLPIIVLSAKAMVEDRVRCLEAGANDFLPKPVDIERLFSLLRVWFYGS